VGFEPTIFWATTRRVNPYTTPAMTCQILSYVQAMGKWGALSYNILMASDVRALNGRYRILHRAGAGGMATVYQAQDLILGRLVAVKVLHESLTGDEAFLRRFQKEAHAAANLTHPNIVTVHDIGQDDRRYYIVMEYVEGWTLKNLIRRHVQRTGEPLLVDRVLDLIVQVCAGIGYAHRSNVIHCDVKPQNVLVTRDYRVKVTDFGIARALSESSVHDDSLVWGTPQYFSPEQAAGEPPTPASDVYSIGVILFEALAGRLPFTAESYASLALKHIHETPPLLTTINPLVPPQVEQVVAKVLSKEPSSRYRTADQLGRVFSTYLQSGAADTGPLQQATQSKQPGDRLELTIPRAEQEAARLAEPAALSAAFNVHVPLPEEPTGPDWTIITLGILAVISLLGLIPLWYLVYLRYTS
jgi:eukaryotic-like serine/threonine-protein kinase